MKVYGFTVLLRDGELTFASLKRAKALKELADWCREYRPGLPQNDEQCKSAYFDGNEEEDVVEFSEDIPLDAPALANLYGEALDAGTQANGDEWLIEQLKHLDGQLPMDCNIYFNADVAQIIEEAEEAETVADLRQRYIDALYKELRRNRNDAAWLKAEMETLTIALPQDWSVLNAEGIKELL